MSAAIQIRSGSGRDNPVATQTHLHIEAVDCPRTYDQTPEHITADPPVIATPITYVMKAVRTGAPASDKPLVSQRFQGPGFKWDGVILPHAGAWTITLYDVSDDSVVATLAVTAG